MARFMDTNGRVSEQDEANKMKNNPLFQHLHTLMMIMATATTCKATTAFATTI